MIISNKDILELKENIKKAKKVTEHLARQRQLTDRVLRERFTV